VSLRPPPARPAGTRRPPAGRAARARPAWLPTAVDVACALLAIAVALGVFLRLRSGLGTELHAASDVIGYPTFHDFDASQYIETFYLGVIGGPMIATAVFAWVRWTAGRLIPSIAAAHRPLLPAARRVMVAGAPVPAAPPPAAAALLGGAALVAGPGGVLGVELAVERNAAGPSFWLLVVAACAAYSIAVVGSAAALGMAGRRVVAIRRLCPSARACVAVVNSLGACLPVMALWAVSNVTSVTSAGGAVHRYGWLSPPLAAALTAGCMGLVAVALWRRRGDPRRPLVVERRSVLLVAVPVLVLIATAVVYTPGAAPLNVFEQGQQVSTVHFLQQGMVPWRDFISDHGLFEDTLKLLLGTVAIEDTAWGMYAGTTLIVVPLGVVGMYWFAHRVGGGAAAFSLLVAVLLLQYGDVLGQTRFPLWPIVLILLWVAVEGRSRWAAPLLGALGVAVTLLTPESAFCAIAVGAAVVAADVYRADLSPGRRLRSFATTLSWLAGCLVTLTVAVLVLARLGAVQGLVTYFRTATSDHLLAGAIPLLAMVPPYSIWAILPAVGVLLAVLILAVKLRRRTVLGGEDAVMLAAAVLTVLYYQKFTSRADLHVLQPFAASVPLLVVVTHQLLRAVDERLPRGAIGGVTFSGALVVGIVTAPVAVWRTVEAIPSHVRGQTPLATETSPSLGWFAPLPQAHDLRAFLSAYLTPGAALYDFTNEPGLFYSALGYAPGARYFTIGSAIPRSAQLDVISDLERSRPRVIAFYGDAHGALPSWDDISNQVRGYEVSRWILDRYRPLAAVGTTLLYVERGLTVPEPRSAASGLSPGGAISTADLYFRGPACDWGYAPEFLDIPHPAGSEAVDARITERSGLALTIRPPVGHAWADYHWIEVEAVGPHFAQDGFVLRDRPNRPGEARQVTFRTLARATPTYRFPIGACAQWRGYGAVPLQLTHTSGSDVAAVRVLP
jgi:hypothetical protein